MYSNNCKITFCWLVLDINGSSLKVSHTPICKWRALNKFSLHVFFDKDSDRVKWPSHAIILAQLSVQLLSIDTLKKHSSDLCIRVLLGIGAPDGVHSSWVRIWWGWIWRHSPSVWRARHFKRSSWSVSCIKHKMLHVIIDLTHLNTDFQRVWYFALWWDGHTKKKSNEMTAVYVLINFTTGESCVGTRIDTGSICWSCCSITNRKTSYQSKDRKQSNANSYIH